MPSARRRPTDERRPERRAPMNSVERRTPPTVFVAVITALVVGALIAGAPQVERLVPRLPEVSGRAGTIAFLGAVAVLVVVALSVRLAVLARCRARRRALEHSFDGAVECGLRHRELDAMLAELLGRRAALSHRFSIVADDLGLSFWSGGRRPRRTALFAWHEIRNIRADEMIAGSRPVPIVVVRVRRDGASIALPIILGTERPGTFAVTDAPFYAVVRSWKAQHRAALEREGLELPPLTAPIPVITREMLAAAR
ncbi:hypothetical protein [Agromyces sp. NPDC058126]|uniref:hypothetical protein n=1 Tax=Agromyces sp. NPDC058126 TaxID=3346350 RepID=UPI0036DA2B99